MRIRFVTRKFGNVERNSHCDVLHITPIRVARLFLDCNGDFAIKAYRPYSRCQILKPSLVFLIRPSHGRRRNNDVTSQEREVTMMLRHDLRTDAQICDTFASQVSIFVHNGRGAVYCIKAKMHQFVNTSCCCIGYYPCKYAYQIKSLIAFELH